MFFLLGFSLGSAWTFSWCQLSDFLSWNFLEVTSISYTSSEITGEISTVIHTSFQEYLPTFLDMDSMHVSRKHRKLAEDASVHVTESSLESCCASLHSIPAPTTRGLSAINL
jgi:hypothetical protein